MRPGPALLALPLFLACCGKSARMAKIKERLEIKNWHDAKETERIPRGSYQEEIVADLFLVGTVRNKSSEKISGLVLSPDLPDKTKPEEVRRIEVGDLAPGETKKFTLLLKSVRDGSFIPRDNQDLWVVDGRIE